MSGNRAGAQKTKQRLIERLGKEGYKKFMEDKARIGGKQSSNSEWALSPEGQKHMRLISAKGVEARHKHKEEVL